MAYEGGARRKMPVFRHSLHTRALGGGSVARTESDMICSGSRNGERTYTRPKKPMDKDERLRNILGKLRGGRLEDVTDKLLALFRAPDWWEEEFEQHCVARGPGRVAGCRYV